MFLDKEILSLSLFSPASPGIIQAHEHCDAIIQLLDRVKPRVTSHRLQHSGEDPAAAGAALLGCWCCWC